MCQYDWPGNIREIQNIIEYLVVTCPNQLITKEFLPGWTFRQLMDGEQLTRVRGLKEQVEEFEKTLLHDAYERAGDTRTMAKILNIAQSSAVRKMQKYGLRCN